MGLHPMSHRFDSYLGLPAQFLPNSVYNGKFISHLAMPFRGNQPNRNADIMSRNQITIKAKAINP